jgi:hypothetical protein
MNINDAIDNVKQDIKEAKKQALELINEQEDLLIMVKARVEYGCDNIISIDATERMMKLIVVLKYLESSTQKLTTLKDCSY